MTRTHTQRYLSAILSSGGANGSSTPSAPASRRTSGSHNPPDSIHSDHSSTVSDDESASIASKSSLSTDEMQNRILETLEDPSLAEEDKPDQLKEQLSRYMPSDSGTDLDAVVLGLLHRHREDLNPTGASFPMPQTPTKASLSRSSSFRRSLAAPALSRRASGLSLNAAGPPSRPHSPSPLSGLKLNSQDMVNHHSLNRHLSVAASEFRPATTSSATASPSGTPGPANWSFNGSPLGTPRFQNSSMAAAQTSYFPSVPSPGLATPSTKDIWADQGPEASQYTPQEHDAVLDEPPDVFHHVNEWQKQQQQAEMRQGTAGLNGNSGLYTMTPLDVLCSIFADSGIASSDMEAALEASGWDVDKAIEHIMVHHNQGPAPPGLMPHHNQGMPPVGPTGMPDPEELARGINNIVLPGAAPRQPTFGRAGMLARNDPFQSPRGSQPSSPRWGSRPHTPTPGGAPGPGGPPLAPYTPSAASNRVCRYYLQGSCLRSDCRYNHDISKAVCRFWLRGHCLKGPDRCDFMHMIPPHFSQDVAAMKMRMDQERRERREREREMEHDDLSSQEDDFPTLGGGANANKGRRDPASTRWASAVKSSRAAPSPALQTLMRDNAMLPSGAAAGAGTDPSSLRSSTGSVAGGPRQSPRITLKPPVLLPTLSTGSKMSESYANYRNKFLELGAARARSLSKAAECWKRGDGAGARMWSREAQAQDLERLAAGREASGLILEERKKLLKEAVAQDLSREGRVDLIADRSARGKEAGSGLGVVLGVTSREGSSQLSPEERTEVAVDLHGLHAEEATDILFRMLSALEREAFLGIAYCVVGQEKHSVQGQVKTRLGEAVSDFLDQYKYPYLTFGGIYAIDPREHI